MSKYTVKVPPQVTFDQCVNHLRKQKKRATKVIKGKIEACYQGNDGLYDPIGILIKDHYIEEFETKTVKDELIEFVLGKCIGHDINLCWHLQKCHDLVAPDQWENEFACIAIMYGITYLPATPFKQISTKDARLMGYLYQGKFVRKEYIPNPDGYFPKLVFIWEDMIHPYSQVCSKTRDLIVDGLHSHITGKPICLFPY